MRKLLIPTLSILCLPLSPLYAEEYRVELDGSYTLAEINDRDVDTFMANVTYFTRPVDDADGPYAEAAFLQRATWIKLGASYSEVDVTDQYDENGDSVSVSHRYVHKRSGFLFDLQLSKGEVPGADIDSFLFGFGGYVMDDTTLVFSVSETELDYAMGTDDTDTLAVVYKSLYTLGAGNKLNIESSLNWSESTFKRPGISEDTDSTTLNVRGDFYLTDMMSIGAQLGFTNADISNAINYGLQGELFLGHKMSVFGALTLTDYNDGDIEDDAAIQIGVRGRF